MTPKMEICFAVVAILMASGLVTGLVVGVIDFTVWEIKRKARAYFYKQNVALRK